MIKIQGLNRGITTKNVIAKESKKEFNIHIMQIEDITKNGKVFIQEITIPERQLSSAQSMEKDTIVEFEIYVFNNKGYTNFVMA